MAPGRLVGLGGHCDPAAAERLELRRAEAAPVRSVIRHQAAGEVSAEQQHPHPFAEVHAGRRPDQDGRLVHRLARAGPVGVDGQRGDSVGEQTDATPKPRTVQGCRR